MSISPIIYEAILRKLSEFKNVEKYTSSYQATFDKVANLLVETSLYTRSSTESYFQVTILMNIGSEYFTLVSAIQKEWKDAATTNLTKTILQIIRHFSFRKESNQDNVFCVIIASGSSGLQHVPKRSYTNPECMQKRLTMHYTDQCWIKNPELQVKYQLNKMKTRGSQRNLKTTTLVEAPSNNATPKLEA